RVSLPAHVSLPGIASALSSASGFLLTSECSADLRTRSADVHIGDSAIASCCRKELLSLAEIKSHDRGRETLGNSVLYGDRFVERSVLKQIKNRSEGLVSHDLHVGLRLGDAGLHVAAAFV